MFKIKCRRYLFFKLKSSSNPTWNLEIHVNVWYLFGFLLASPNVTMAQSSYSVLTNGDVTLSCFVSANPSASISWTFTSNSGSVTAISASTSKYSLATSTTASSLTVRSANSNDQGSYRCSATNSVGTGQATAILVVSGSMYQCLLRSWVWKVVDVKRFF